MRLIPSACPHDCPGGCAFLVGRDGDRVVIEANGRLPWTTFVCPKGKRWARRLFDGRRLTTPLLRKGEDFVPLSVDGALDLWAENLWEGVSRQGPLSVFFYQGAGSLYFSKNLLAHPLAELGGYRTTRGSLCGAAGNAGLAETFGAVPVQSAETLLSSAKAVLLWGRNVTETHPHLLPLLNEIRRRGGRLGTVEIRETPTTAFVDRWWRIHPGGDAFLAAWLCRQILVRGLAPREWEQRVTNKEPFRELLAGSEDSHLLREAGLADVEAEALLTWLLDGPVTHYGGYGLQRYLHGKESYRWIAALAVLLGAFDRPGAGVLLGKDEMARFPSSLLPRPKEAERLPVATWHRELEKRTPAVEHLIVTGANPLQQAPDERGLRERFRSIPFKVCLDLTLTETARACDLILPVATFLEEGPDWRGSYWHRYLVRSEPLLAPPPSVLPETAWFGGLARRLGLGADPEKLLKTLDETLLADGELEACGDGVYAWAEKEFWRDPSARAALPEALPQIRKAPKECLRLVTVHVADYINGQSWDAPSAGETLLLRMAPSEMARRGLKTGQAVTVRSETGASLELAVTSDEGLPPQIVTLPQGRPAVNALTPPLSSSGFGAPYHETFVEIIPKGVSQPFRYGP